MQTKSTCFPVGFQPATGMLGGFASFDELYAAFRTHVDLHMRAGAEAQKRVYDEAAAQSPYLRLSVLYDDCLDRARPIFSGGVRHLGRAHPDARAAVRARLDDHFAEIARLAKAHDGVMAVDVLPWYNWGTEKCERVGRESPIHDLPNPDAATVAAWREAVRRYGFEQVR